MFFEGGPFKRASFNNLWKMEVVSKWFIFV